jgi:3-dehydroquinate synthase
MSDQELTLQLGERAVPIVLSEGGVEWAADRLRRLLPASARIMLVSDERVALFYERGMKDALCKGGFSASSFIFPVGEEEKRLPRVVSLLDELAAQKFARDDVVVALGGGVVSDMAGFAAAIYRRGMPWVAVPTTLLAMVDAAIGGKTGVDHPLGKNLIGTFHEPMSVLAPLNVLGTLDDREWLSGSAEVVKSALLAGGELWDRVLEYGPNLHNWESLALHKSIFEAMRVKIGIVEKDERETGPRRLLNLGHTFGHALEAAGGYKRFTHGEAIFLGLRAVVRMSGGMRLMNKAAAQEVDELLARVPVPRAALQPGDLLDALGHDKKTASGKLHWVLLEAPGRAVIRDDVPDSLVSDTAAWLCSIVRAGRVQGLSPRRPRVAVINGPNLNLLGRREPELYGHDDYEQLEEFLRRAAEDEQADVLILQHNVEGELVSIIQRLRHWADGILINPGGYAHTSVAIRDALASVCLPTVEVHLTDISRREPFRAESLSAPICLAVVKGEGIAGYGTALKILLSHLKNEVWSIERA